MIKKFETTLFLRCHGKRTRTGGGSRCPGNVSWASSATSSHDANDSDGKNRHRG